MLALFFEEGTKCSLLKSCELLRESHECGTFRVFSLCQASFDMLWNFVKGFDQKGKLHDP